MEDSRYAFPGTAVVELGGKDSRSRVGDSGHLGRLIEWEGGRRVVSRRVVCALSWTRTVVDT